MKIAQISPLYESVPPKFYGGTERVVHYLTEELVAQGHEVTLFASGDSRTNAMLVAPHPRALRSDDQCIDKLAPHFRMMELVEAQAHHFDIIHSHLDYLYYPIMRRSKSVHLTTLHGRLDLPELRSLYREYSDLAFISVSNAQRKPLSFVNWASTIHHGLPKDLYSFNSKPGQYLAFIGRASKEKRVDRAIEVAIKANIPIKIAAKVDKADAEYFNHEIKPLLDHPLVEFLGEINGLEKKEFLENAMGLLFLIDWPEPFGLSMIEALACGTPVVAYANGSVGEVIDDGITGFIVHSQEEALKAVEKLPQISREKCRHVFEQRFTASRMVADYLAIYERLLLQSGRERYILQHNERKIRHIIQNNSLYGTQTNQG